MTSQPPALIPDHTPASAAPAQFSREDQATFLDALSAWGSVRSAARASGVSRSTVYRMRRACPRFRDLWDAALLIARPQVEEVLADRALNGVEETVYYHGEEVAKRTRYSDRLLLAHLGRLDRLVQDRAVRGAASGFEEELDDLLEAPEILFVASDTVTSEPVAKNGAQSAETPTGEAGEI